MRQQSSCSRNVWPTSWSTIVFIGIEMNLGCV
jgi:hypothetical protein